SSSVLHEYVERHCLETSIQPMPDRGCQEACAKSMRPKNSARRDVGKKQVGSGDSKLGGSNNLRCPNGNKVPRREVWRTTGQCTDIGHDTGAAIDRTFNNAFWEGATNQVDYGSGLGLSSKANASIGRHSVVGSLRARS